MENSDVVSDLAAEYPSIRRAEQDMTIKEICERYDIGQSALARRFGIPIRTVQHWYLGARQPPSYVTDMIVELLDGKREKPEN